MKYPDTLASAAAYRADLIKYLQWKMLIEDWHGVRDVAVDIEAIEVYIGQKWPSHRFSSLPTS